MGKRRRRKSPERLHELRLNYTDVETLIGRYHTRQDYLHGYCFYLGVCEPVDEVKRRIIETIEYIEDARKLTKLQANRK